MATNLDNNPWNAPFVGVNPLLNDAAPEDQGFHGGNVGAFYAQKKIDNWLPDNLNRPLTPEEAQAMIVNLLNAPIQATKGTFIIDNSGWFSRAGGSFTATFPGRPGYHIDDPKIEDQSAAPNNPGIRKATASTYGKVIPISFGRRRMDGNLIQSSELIPSLVGNVVHDVTYSIPIYEDPPLLDDTTTEVKDAVGCTFSFKGCVDNQDAADADLFQFEQFRTTETKTIANEAGPGFVEIEVPSQLGLKNKKGVVKTLNLKT